MEYVKLVKALISALIFANKRKFPQLLTFQALTEDVNWILI